MADVNSTTSPFQSVAPIITVSSFSFPLTFFYFALATLAAVSIGRVLYFKHKFLSFQGGFLTLSLIWSLLRAVLLLFVDLVRVHAPNIFRLLLWLPEVFQLATFSLLVIFFASILRTHGKRLFIVAYCILNGLFLLSHVLVYGLHVGHAVGIDSYHEVEGILDAFCFSALAFLLALSGGLLIHRLGNVKQVTPTLASLGRGSSRLKTTIFVVFVVTILTSRAAVEMLLAFDVVEFSEFRRSAGFKWDNGVWFMAFVIWEVIPILIFIISYWPASSSSSHTPGMPDYATIDDMSINSDPQERQPLHKKPISIREAEPLVASNLFSNTARYDSDGEETHFETASGSLYSPYMTNSPKLKLTSFEASQMPRTRGTDK